MFYILILKYITLCLLCSIISLNVSSLSTVACTLSKIPATPCGVLDFQLKVCIYTYFYVCASLQHYSISFVKYPKTLKAQLNLKKITLCWICLFLLVFHKRNFVTHATVLQQYSRQCCNKIFL